MFAVLPLMSNTLTRKINTLAIFLAKVLIFRPLPTGEGTTPSLS
jgi:hypothetical protein